MNVVQFSPFTCTARAHARTHTFAAFPVIQRIVTLPEKCTKHEKCLILIGIVHKCERD